MSRLTGSPTCLCFVAGVVGLFVLRARIIKRLYSYSWATVSSSNNDTNEGFQLGCNLPFLSKELLHTTPREFSSGPSVCMFRHYRHNQFWKDKTFRLFSGCLLFVECFSSKDWITISDPDHQLFCCALAISATINSISTFCIQSHFKNTLKLKFRASHSVEGLTPETLDLESLCGGHYKFWTRFIKSNDNVTIFLVYSWKFKMPRINVFEVN